MHMTLDKNEAAQLLKDYEKICGNDPRFYASPCDEGFQIYTAKGVTPLVFTTNAPDEPMNKDKSTAETYVGLFLDSTNFFPAALQTILDEKASKKELVTELSQLLEDIVYRKISSEMVSKRLALLVYQFSDSICDAGVSAILGHGAYPSEHSAPMEN